MWRVPRPKHSIEGGGARGTPSQFWRDLKPFTPLTTPFEMSVVIAPMGNAGPVRPARHAWIQYSAGLIAFTTVLLVFLAMIHVRGGFAHPYWFFFFRRLFYLQYALFGGAILATLLY